MTLYDLFNDDNVKSIGEDAPAFLGELEEIALVNSVNAKKDFLLKRFLIMEDAAISLGQPEIKKLFLHNA